MAKLVNLGSLCIDFVYSVPNLVGAGETIASSERQIFPGGKGLNQSLAAAKAGAAVAHFGAVGDDGEMLLETLRTGGVDIDGVARLQGPSGHAVIQVDSTGQNAIIISGGSNRKISKQQVTQTISYMGEGDWLLLQNEINDVGVVMQNAADAGIRIAFNVAPPDERIFDYPIDVLSLLVVNEPEAMALAKETDTQTAFDTLVNNLPNTHIVLTQGQHGLLCYDYHSKAQWQMSAFSVEPVDETAAGDSFVGYLMASLVDGTDLIDALPRASAAGALAVTREGAAPSIPAIEEVDDLLAAQTIHCTQL